MTHYIERVNARPVRLGNLKCVRISTFPNMTAQTLFGLLKYIDRLEEKLSLEANLEAIKTALTSLVSAPAQPQHQSALATALAAFTDATGQLPRLITPAQSALIHEIGGGEFFDSALGGNIRNSIERNAMTPSVARDFVTDIASRRSAFLTVTRHTATGLQQLQIKESSLSPGTADLAFLIPRDLFKNHLDAFAKELSFINRLLQHISEGVSGEAQPVVLENLSSSIPTIGLQAQLKAIELLATIVNKFLDAWEKIAKIRKIRGEMTEMGITGPPVEHLTKQITTTVEEVVEESTEIVLIRYQGETARRNELKNALANDTRHLLGQIERGLTIEFHAEPKEDATEEDQQSLGKVADLGRTLVFPAPSQEPILLESGEVFDGDGDRMSVVKKTVSRKKTTTKKEVTNGEDDKEKNPE